MFSPALSAVVILGMTGPLVNAAVTQNRAYNLMRRADAPIGVIPECQTLLAGQKPTDGLVCLSVSGGNLIVTYSPAADFSYKEVHVWVGTGTPPDTAPGQFPYTDENGYCDIADDKQSATCTIPLDELEGNLCSTEFSIASHANLGTETGWGDGQCIKEDCNPWARYSKFKFECGEPTPESSTTKPAESSTTKPAESSKTSVHPASTDTETPLPTRTTTTTITYTTTTCPVTKPCHPVTSTAVVTATLIATVTVPCETSTYVSSGTTAVTTITKAPITTYVTCPEECPTTTTVPPPPPKAPAANATYPIISTGKPVPTASAKPDASPFTGGSSTLGVSFGGLLALAALFGLML